MSTATSPRPPSAPMRILVPALLGLLLFASPAARADDHDETEFRLKKAGVEEPLRREVKRAIDRGVAYLRAKQRSDGSFYDVDGYEFQNEAMGAGVTALVALALRHADTVDGNAAADRALDWMLRDGKGLRPPLPWQVYAGGITAMLLQASDRAPESSALIARNLAAGLPESGWWGYFTGDPEPVIGLSRVRPRYGLENLSTAQFGALGLWAASRQGAPVPVDAWKKHVASLLSWQKRDHSWAYVPGPYPGSYECGTFMGVANLILGRAALASANALPDNRREVLDAAVERGLVALRKDGRHLLWRLERLPVDANELPFGLYCAYALEKACVFAGWEDLDGVPWYASLARSLVRLQEADGSWQGPGMGPHEMVNTAFALLILVRASETYRTVTPRVPGHRGTATEPSMPAPTPPPAPPAPPPPAPVELVDARDALDLLGMLLARKPVDSAAARRTLEFLGDALARPVDDGSAAHRKGWEEFRRDLGRTLLAMAAARPATMDLDLRVAALRLLGRFDAAWSPSLRQLLEKGPLGDRGAPQEGVFLDAAFAALGTQADPRTLPWITDDVLRGDDEEGPERISIAALRCVPAFASAPGALRREACERILNRFTATETAAADDQKGQGARIHWASLRPDTMDALDALSGTFRPTLAEFRKWFRDHDRPVDAAWK